MPPVFITGTSSCFGQTIATAAAISKEVNI